MVLEAGLKDPKSEEYISPEEWLGAALKASLPSMVFPLELFPAPVFPTRARRTERHHSSVRPRTWTGLTGSFFGISP